jgi:TorA maturation chaperone TorD
MAALYRLIARGFAYPAPGHVAAMRQGFRRLLFGRRRGPLAPSLAKAVDRARLAWQVADGPRLAAEHLRLFAGRAEVALRETGYGDGRRFGGQPVELADIAGFYRAFGLKLSATEPDLPDHLGAELEFLSVLLVKAAYADSRGWTRRAYLARDGAKRFLAEHLGRWVPGFAAALDAAGARPPYRALAAVLVALVAHDCFRLGARSVPMTGRPATDEMHADVFECPAIGAAAADRHNGGAAWQAP